MTAPGPAGPGPRGSVLSASFALVAAAALAVSLASSVATVVVGVVVLGVLHAILELRYVAGRFAGLALRLGRPFLRTVALLLAGIVVSRLLGGVLGRPADIAEILLGYAIVGLALPHVLAPTRRNVGWALTAAAAALSLLWPDQHFLVLAHLHLVAVVAFLWEWSRRLPSVRTRILFRSVQLAWAMVVPVAVLLGLADAWLGTDPAFVRSLVDDGRAVVAAIVPPGEAGTVLGARLVTVFAFLQTMHLLTWVVFFPHRAPDAAAGLEELFPWLTGARVWAIGFLAAAFFAVVLVGDYSSGVLLQDALTLPHVYVEVPLLLALLARSPLTSESDHPEPAPTTAQGTPQAPPEVPVQNPLAHAANASYGRGSSKEGGDPRSDFFRNV
ncbi:hypothetical protein [Intrasporangium sp.]|uniref:hypothetical protein n=1 Tax=Intrasporangium sp. TaxID=1925024 RepID=UPI00293AA18F|nr:hypothetical protein [Intrasporangium sp.]MDV3222342.1 hypothetical protein [Intrasporangium sp.]